MSTKVLTDPVELSRTLQGGLQTTGVPPGSLDAPKDPSGLLPTTSAAGMEGATALPPTFAPSILPSDSGEKTNEIGRNSEPSSQFTSL